jgi:hypothetical protein
MDAMDATDAMDASDATGSRFLRRAARLTAGVLCIAFALSVAPFADAQARKSTAIDPCDPAYVPKKGETPAACPGVVDVVLEPSQGASAAFPKNPPPVESRRTAQQQGRAVANAPAFQMLRDGSSKLYLQVHGVPKVSQVTTRGGVTYVLSNCAVPIHNNRHALLTNHFNTPVSDARLRPFQHDVHFRIDLRANVIPKARLVELEPGKVVMLEVTFPPGNYAVDPARDPERGRKKSGDDTQPSKTRNPSGPNKSEPSTEFGPPVP